MASSINRITIFQCKIQLSVLVRRSAFQGYWIRSPTRVHTLVICRFADAIIYTAICPETIIQVGYV